MPLPSAVETWGWERWDPAPRSFPPTPCAAPCPHLQGDVGPGPVLQVGELQVRVTVHEVDAQQLLALGAAEAGQALAEGAGAPLHAGGPVLALGSLAGAGLAGGTGRHLAQLPTAGPRACWARGWESSLPGTPHPTGCWLHLGVPTRPASSTRGT